MFILIFVGYPKDFKFRTSFGLDYMQLEKLDEWSYCVGLGFCDFILCAAKQQCAHLKSAQVRAIFPTMQSRPRNVEAIDEIFIFRVSTEFFFEPPSHICEKIRAVHIRLPVL